MNAKKYFSFLLLLSILFFVQPNVGRSEIKEEPPGFVDNSLRDMTVVVGAGAFGAVMGLSTLSFVDTPTKHLRNIAVGGALGIVAGVGVVIFSQATRTTSIVSSRMQIPEGPLGFEHSTRHEFLLTKIAQTYLLQPHVGYSFSF